MRPIEFEGSSEVQKPEDMTDEQCLSIWAFNGVDDQGLPFYLTAWKPSFEDLQAMNRGEPIWVKTITNGLPPMSIFTVNAAGEMNDAKLEG